MNEELALLVIGILYLLNRFSKKLSDMPVIFDNIRIEDTHEHKIHIKLLYYRGYTRYRKGDGRLYIETKVDDRRKIIIRKHNFRNHKGLIMYVPLYDKDTEKRLKEILGELNYEGSVWKEERAEVSGMEVLGFDMCNDIPLCARLIKESGNIIFSEAQKKKLILYYKNVSDLDNEFDVRIEDTGEDEETKRKIDVAVRWSRKVGETIGKIINPFG
jgi:hypothetical protein